ncbi:MAG: DUF4145 domain-containing protein [Patescibacteria group bacterium]|nr:DUF4145 domain-containing protein [Patescibacteria group bacterium]
MSQVFEYDKTKDKNFKLPCGNCDSRTNHKVLSSVEYDWYIDGPEISGNDSFEIIVCLGCDALSFRHVSSDSDSVDMDEYGNLNAIEREILYPSRITGRRQIENTHLLPLNIRKIYEETHGALCSRFAILAGIGIRTLAESICKEKDTVGINLEKKIDDLVIKGILTRNNAEVLHKTRLLGNRSAHEFVEPKEQELDIAMDIIENLLENVYIIPERAKRLKIDVA